MKSNIVLIGMPGAGKSTVGVILAKTLGYDFIDTDILLSREHGKPLQKLLEDVGLEAFLQLEGELGARLSCENTVIATGGSMVLSETGMRHLGAIGDVVYLEVPYEELERRIKNITTRGITFGPGETLADLFRSRKPLYERYAEIIIPRAEHTEAAVSAIITARR